MHFDFFFDHNITVKEKVLFFRARAEKGIARHIDASMVAYRQRQISQSEIARLAAIRRRKKDGDWYIYSKRAYKNTKKNCKSFKLDKSNAVCVGMTAIKPYLFVCLRGFSLVRKVLW